MTFKRDPEIEALDLRTSAKRGAYILKTKHPPIQFNSGRRDKFGQAWAMAKNILLNRKWIGQTYKRSDASIACQKWVDDHPEAATREEVTAGFLEVFGTLTDDQIGKLSWHLSGDAFDVQPVEKNAEQIKADIRALPDLDTFMEKEGGLVRWHAQFINNEGEPFVFQTPISVA